MLLCSELLGPRTARTAHRVPTVNAHRDAPTTVRADLFEYHGHPGKFCCWGQATKALGRNIPQGSTYEKPGKTGDRLAARISLALSSSDVTQQVPRLLLSSWS